MACLATSRVFLLTLVPLVMLPSACTVDTTVVEGTWNGPTAFEGIVSDDTFTLRDDRTFAGSANGTDAASGCVQAVDYSGSYLVVGASTQAMSITYEVYQRSRTECADATLNGASSAGPGMLDFDWAVQDGWLVLTPAGPNGSLVPQTYQRIGD